MDGGGRNYRQHPRRGGRTVKALEMAFACLSYIAFLAFVLGESKDEWEEDGLGLSPTGCPSLNR